ncbi:ATM-like protein [Mya arenaria]|uniref:non-specific serine/threonine protein kinase n=1 Tax=Mya arenaria TaxID=6604 RepID=A0ABY7EK38_MYAAR|nr:ATM-like protein [Mya arenaria]
MDRQTSDLINLCRAVNSERGPERRKAAVKLINSLHQSGVKKSLDKNFEIKALEGKKARVFTWENVFRATKTGRETRKKDISGLVKTVIRAADKGSPKLKGSLLFEHIKTVLMELFSCDAYGQDYCSIMLKNVLTVRKYVVELTTEELHNFFLKSKQHKSGLIVQHLLSALNVLVGTITPTSRVQVCRLGEDIVHHLLYLWHNIATEELKDCLLEFLQVQVWCHHPRGDKQGGGGAFAVNWDTWMSHLRKLYDLMYSEIQQIGAKSRLQLVTGILDKHPSSFPQDETLPYLTCLSQIVGDCKRADLMNHVQRFVSLHNTEPEGYLLLSAMISQGLVTPRRDLWSLFVPSISQPITESVQFLCQLLTSCDLPEQLVPSLVISVPSQTGNTSFPLRKQLIDWLFPSREEEGESSRSFKLNPDWTAKALVALTLNDPSGVKIDLFVKKGAISDIERIYLQTCLELPLQANKNLVPKKNIEKTSDSAHLSTLLNVVENMIKQEVQYLCSRSDEQAPNILEAVNFCQLISNILFQLLSQNIFTTATVSHSNLYTHLVTLMKKISKCLHDIVKKDGAAGTGSVIEALGRLFDWSLCEAELGGVMACLCRAATPAQLTDVLMDIAADKHSKENNHAHISDASLKESRFERSRSRVLDLDDDEFDLDLESEGTSNRNNNNMEVDDLDFDVEIETQDSDDSSINVEVSQSLLTAQLNEAQTLRMLAVCSLCAWCTHSRASTRELKLKPEMDLKYLKNKLVGLLSDETLDPKRIFDLQMMVKITSQLTDVTENLTTKELLVIVTAIRLCVSAHRKDQEVCVASLELMIRLVPHLSDSDNVSSSTLREAQSIVLVLANAFWRLETYASPVRRKLAVLMETLHEHDPEVRWSRFKSEEEENSPDSQGASGPTPGERFINCLADDCLLVRSQTTQAIHKLFIQCQKPVTRSTQEEMFALIYKELSELVDICLPVALFSLLQFIQEKHLAVHKVCKLVGKVSTFLGYTSLEQFVTSHLPYLIHRWLQLEFPIKKFPYHLLNCSDRTQFYRDHLDALIPELVVFKALPAIKEISVSLGATHKDILQSLIPRIVTHILPVLERQIVNNLDEIVVNILGCLHDTDSDIGPIRDTNPEPNPPFYNTLAVTSTLDYITRSFAGKDKSLVEILSKTTDSLQKILLKLSSSLWASHRVSEKRRVLSILSGVESSYRENIACSALQLLMEISTVAVDCCSKEFQKYLGLLAGNLVPIVEMEGDIGEQSLRLLKFLILEKAGELRTGIASLDNFPDRLVFKECRAMHHKLKYATGPFILKQEVEHFLSADHFLTLDGSLRLEGLHFLCDQLLEARNQLHVLARDDTMLRLVCKLVELSRCDDESVAMVAGRCLGVMGPVDMKTICFPSPPTHPSLQMALTCFECASTVLKELLSVSNGVDFAAAYKVKLGDMEYLFKYLHPFRASKKRAVHVNVPGANWEVFQSTVDMDDLWNPADCCHDNWIISLTTTLINSGAVRDEILQLLGPVCKIKREFCELVLPFIIHDVLVSGGDDHHEVLSRQMSRFFSDHCGQSEGRVSRCQSMTAATTSSDWKWASMNVDSVRVMLEVVQYLRQQPRPKKGRREMTPWDNNFWLDIDYLKVAMAAQYVSAHFSTLMYAEIWFDVQREKQATTRSSQSQKLSQSLSEETRLDNLSGASQTNVPIQGLLLEAYTWIGDPDGETGTVLTSNTRELQFESAWRVGQWNLDVPNKTSALLRLQGGCLDSTKQLYSAMADLQKSDGTSLPLLSDTVYTDTEFAVLDPVLHMQCTSSRLLHEKLGANTLFKDVVTSLKQLAVTARQANRHQISERAIASLKQLCGSDPGLAIPCTIEEARLFWARGEQNIAKHLIRASIDKLNKLRTTDSECAKMFPKALGIYGDWLAETRSENPNIIMENYMEKTIALYEELGEDKETSVDAYLSLARYADTQYQNIVNYMRSSTFEAKQTLMRNAKEEAERLRESEIDELELSRMQEDRQLFLLKAVQNYIQCLRSGDTHNLRVFRLTSLWFNNIDNELVNSMIQGCVSSISTYKWLPLMYQLAARMDVKPHNGTTEEFLNTLNKLMYDTAVEHPHHTLFCILALANANRDTELLQQAPIPLPDALWISKLKDLKKVPVPTKDIMVKPSGDYSDVPYLVKFEPTFKLAGGINLPKIISCMGSDGSKNRQLVKGRDDLRQDAVMEQVFGMVNSLLKKDPATRKRQLHVRQYKSATTVEGKYKAYQQICEKFQPVFRHFFLERFAAPPVWFQRRLAYTRSIATNSIVGYILGLGDRHPQNILIDCNTAELVHIDLGVAFEQGEILPTPETVPFRLTRDIEDAMGASGVEGGFRRCCEATLEVMRHNQESLLTILEVLLYDPLHAWTISPAKAFALQHRRGGESGDTVDVGNTTSGDIMDYAENHSNRTNSATQESANKLAERVLLRLQQKLAGVEDGVQLSLNGQVNHLIQEARNPHNLSRLFPGWQPYI